MNTAGEIVGWVITIGYIIWMAATLSSLRRRLNALERNETTRPALGVGAMDAADNATALVAGLRNQLIAQGFSPEGAEQIVLNMIQAGKK